LAACSTQVSQEVELFGRVVLVDVYARSVELVATVFDRPDPASGGLLYETNVVTKSPAEQDTIVKKVEWRSDTADIEGFDLGVARIDVSCFEVNVFKASPVDDDHARS
jgi:hypothetical protein